MPVKMQSAVQALLGVYIDTANTLTCLAMDQTHVVMSAHGAMQVPGVRPGAGCSGD